MSNSQVKSIFSTFEVHLWAYVTSLVWSRTLWVGLSPLRPYWTFHIPRNDQEVLTFGLLWVWYCLRFWPFCPWSHFAGKRTLDKSASPCCCWRGRRLRKKKMMMLPRLSSAWPFLQQRQRPLPFFLSIKVYAQRDLFEKLCPTANN